MRTSFTIDAAPLDALLDHDAILVYADNFTPQFIFLPGANRFITPNKQGLAFALDRTTRARAIFQAPPGNAQPAAKAGAVCILTFSDD